jgi:AcrR family transcriptional regulator
MDEDPTSPPATRPLEGPPQETRGKILETAEVQFAKGGFSGVGMRQLAAAASLSKSALFHHFPTKLDLYEEVLSRVLERLESGLDSSKPRSNDPVDLLSAWIDSVVRTLAEDIPASRLLLRSLVEEDPFPAFVLEPGAEREMRPFEIRLARILTRVRTLIEEGVETGVFRPLSVPDAIQTTIGAIVFHFASGDVGDALIGESIFSAAAVERRRKEVSEFIRRGFLV